MVTYAWHSLMMALVALSLFLGCASSPYVGNGALLGGGLGAVTGAAIGHRNPWQGAAIGGLIGTVAGAAGGLALQPRQFGQPPQGYYYQQPAPGYSTPAPRAYGYNTPAPYGYNRPAPGPAYGYNAPGSGPSAGGAYGGYNTPNPVTPPGPQYSAAPASAPYSQSQAPQPSGVRTPITPAPYTNYE